MVAVVEEDCCCSDRVHLLALVLRVLCPFPSVVEVDLPSLCLFPSSFVVPFVRAIEIAIGTVVVAEVEVVHEFRDPSYCHQVVQEGCHCQHHRDQPVPVPCSPGLYHGPSSLVMADPADHLFHSVLYPSLQVLLDLAPSEGLGVDLRTLYWVARAPRDLVRLVQALRIVDRTAVVHRSCCSASVDGRCGTDRCHVLGLRHPVSFSSSRTVDVNSRSLPIDGVCLQSN